MLVDDLATQEAGWELWYTLQWRHNKRDGVSNHRRLDCLLNRLFRRRPKKTSKLRITGFCEGKSPVTSEFPAQRAETRKIFPFDGVIMIYIVPRNITVLILTSKEIIYVNNGLPTPPSSPVGLTKTLSPCNSEYVKELIHVHYHE